MNQYLKQIILAIAACLAIISPLLVKWANDEGPGGEAGTGGVVATAGMAGAGGKSGAGGSGGTGPVGCLVGGDGWTTYCPSADTIVVYVSTSGNDANDGRSPAAAVKTPDRGKQLLRTGFPDWLLFRRGDVWAGEIGGWDKSGRSKTERMVVGAYGDTAQPRPRFEFLESWLVTSGGYNDVIPSMDHLVFVSLHAHGFKHDPALTNPPTGKNPYCVNWLRGAQNVRFEDVRFEFCQVNFQDFDGIEQRGLHFFRNLFLDSYQLASMEGHAQGLYLDGAFETVVEENVFINCGMHPQIVGAVPTMFNHCIYWQENGPPDGVVRNNVIMRGSSHGLQMRSGGRVEGNVFAGNAIGGFVGAEYDRPPAAGIREGYAIGNLYTEGEDISPRGKHPALTNQRRGWAWEISQGGSVSRVISNLEFRDNIAAHCRSVSLATCVGMPSSLTAQSLFANNITWNWGGVPNTAGSFVDPNRTLATYSAHIGGLGTFEGFELELRKQSKDNWRKPYTAPEIVRYFREGFVAR